MRGVVLCIPLCATVATETDATMTLEQLQAFVNRLAGTIRRRLPRVLLSASLKLKENSRWDDRTGKTALARWYSDEALRAAGGDVDGTLDLRQYQYYPEAASGERDSPFLHSAAALRAIHRQPETKPSLVGEFPIEGIVKAAHSPTAFDLAQAYETLWDLRHAGGFTCMAERYYQMGTRSRAHPKLAPRPQPSSLLSRLFYSALSRWLTL
eukprot:2370302-Prymnesium_polylepis.2